MTEKWNGISEPDDLPEPFYPNDAADKADLDNDSLPHKPRRDIAEALKEMK